MWGILWFLIINLSTGLPTKNTKGIKYKAIFDIFLWINKMVFGMFFVQTTLTENLL